MTMSSLARVDRTFRLFAYGSLLRGERDHDVLAGAEELGVARTRAEYYLVELTAFPALVAGGKLTVVGELYRIDVPTLLKADIRKEHPKLFQRQTIVLDDGEPAEAYLMGLEQVRGRRRLKVGDWRRRFEPLSSPLPKSPWSHWARDRFK
jgi:gamma-glutamylcyclotransferase (GGCT)/AIG2-like uncharacterized protein YtfP